MSKTVYNERLLDFLVRSYFGCDRNELEDSEQQKCAYRAYLDLARTVKYLYSSSEIEKAKPESDKSNFGKARKSLIENICADLVKDIKDYPQDFNDFDVWHTKKCDWISKQMNAVYDKDKKFLKEPFTYGQAQKWLNMTLKYLWLLNLLPSNISEELLHVPIDSFILQALQETGKFDESQNEIIYSGETYRYKGETWSAMSEENYESLQKKIREIVKEKKISPIEWEYSAWIKIAKERSIK